MGDVLLPKTLKPFQVIPIIDPLAHVFLREVRQLPLPSGVLGTLASRKSHNRNCWGDGGGGGKG